MPRRQTLKVFRTPIGFHDAYVAAPSQKVALEAWGADRDLFARGVAERVEDPELAREPLTHPGKVIRRSRGTTAEQIAALPKAAKRKRSEPEAAPAPGKPKPRKRAAKPKPKPRPDRAPLDRAEAAVAEAEARQRNERAELAKREAALVRERRRLDQRHEAEIAKLARAADAARERYRRAMRDWQG